LLSLIANTEVLTSQGFAGAGENEFENTIIIFPKVSKDKPFSNKNFSFGPVNRDIKIAYLKGSQLLKMDFMERETGESYPHKDTEIAIEGLSECLEKLQMEKMDDKEVLKDYHLALLECMRQREGAMLNFCGVLITALGGFAWALHYNSNLLLFSSVSLICILILAWGAMSALCLSYHHRCFQKVMSKIERKICLKDFLPPKWNVPEDKTFSLWEFLPEIYRWHIICFSFIIILITSILVYKKFSIVCIWQKWIFIMGVIMLFWSTFHFRLLQFKKGYEKLYEKKCETKTKGILPDFFLRDLHIKRLRKTD